MPSPSPRAYRPPDIDFDDVAAALRSKSDADLRAANLVLWTIRRPWMMRTGRLLARAGLAMHVPGTEKALETTVFRQFCGGTTLEAAIERAADLYRSGIGSILDYAVEGEDSEEGFDAVSAEIGRVIDATAIHPQIPMVAVKVTGLSRFGLLEKVSAAQALSDDERAELDRVEARLHALARRAAEAEIALFIDAEHSWIQPAIDQLVARLMEAYNRERAVVLTTVQLYLRGRLEALRQAIAAARKGGYHLGVKLVRGAYLELENERADELGYPSPVQPSKRATDADYDRATTLCLQNLEVVEVCIATHNIASTRHLVSEMARLGVDRSDPRVTASQLLGMFDRVTFPLAEHGYNALKYVPYGEVREALPYLLRRADENKSVADQLASELEAVRQEMSRRGLRAL